VEFVLAIAIGGASFVFGHAALRFSRTVRRLSDEEWRSHWRSLDPERRKAIQRTMRRGEPVRSHDDAALALRAISQVEVVRTAMRPVELTAVLVFVTVVAVALILGFKLLAIVLVIAAGVLAMASAWSAWLMRRMRQSAEATRRLMAAEHAGG
jgi:hypothetical protein